MYIKIPVNQEKDLSICTKFVLTIHAYLHLQNNIFNFSYLQKIFAQNFRF